MTRNPKKRKNEPLSLQQEHDIQYKRVHKHLSDIIESSPGDTKEMFSLVLHAWEEEVLEESKANEAFALYGFPSKTRYQLVPENRIHEGRNPRPWTGEGSEKVQKTLYVIDIDQNPFEVDDDTYNTPLPLNKALKQALAVTNQRFFTEDGRMKQPTNPECRRIYQGLLAAARARHRGPQ